MIINWDDVPTQQKSASHRKRELDCGSFFLTLHEYSPGWKDEAHSHPEDQFGYVVQGNMRLCIEGTSFEQGEGQSVFISGELEHSASTPTQKTICLNLYVKPGTWDEDIRSGDATDA